MPLNRGLVFTPAARAELVDALVWYENESTGLGFRFNTEVDALIERICANPRQFPIVHRNVRRALLRKFPYALMFVVESDGTVTVIACFHGSRDPGRWQQRL